MLTVSVRKWGTTTAVSKSPVAEPSRVMVLPETLAIFTLTNFPDALEWRRSELASGVAHDKASAVVTVAPEILVTEDWSDEEQPNAVLTASVRLWSEEMVIEGLGS